MADHHCSKLSKAVKNSKKVGKNSGSEAISFVDRSLLVEN